MKVTDIQRFCMHDGPGVRTTVFLKGCPLSCKWCHNPEARASAPMLRFTENRCIYCGSCEKVCPQGVHRLYSPCENPVHSIDRSRCISCGKCVENCPGFALAADSSDMTDDEIISEVIKDTAFYGARGGVTLSGGEPFFHAEDSIRLLGKLKALGINTAVETCGFWNESFCKRAVDVTDTFLWDIKDTDDTRHREYTGVPLAPIVSNLRACGSLGANIILRCIIVNNVNCNEDHIKKLAELALSVKGISRVDFMPCRDIANAKYAQYGIETKIKREWSPEPERFECLKTLFEKLTGFPVNR